MAQQLKYLLETVVWPSGAGDVVFGANGVRVYAGEPTEEQIPPAFPFALVGIGSGLPDEDDPTLITQTFTVMSCVMVGGDPMGEHAVIGGPAANLGKSAGRGSAEVAERVRSALQDLTGADGAKIQTHATSMSAPSILVGRHIVVEEQEITALCTSQLHYTAPQEIDLTGSVWTWEGGQCSARGDFKQYRLGWKGGAVPPETPGDATIVYTGTAPTTSVGATGGRAYSVFADYSSREQTGVVEGSSSGSEVGSFVTT